MRKVLILTAGLALAATSAWGQPSSRDRDDDGRGGWREDRGRWHSDSDDRPGYGMRYRSMRDDDDDDDRRGGGNAHFFLRSGDTQLRVVCGDRESTQACVDAALRMFDRVQSQQGAASRSPSTSPAPTSPPSPQ